MKTIVQQAFGMLLLSFVLFLNTSKAQNTVFNIIANSPDHSTLEVAILAAELDDDLSGAGPFTVFAPTNAAFTALPAGVLDALLLDPTGALAQVLLYHVANGKVMSTDLSDEQMILTLQGKSVKVDIIGPDVFINNAKVTLANLVADNGVVHVIDAVILPPAPTTVVDIIVNSPDHTTLEAAVIAAQLADDLSGAGPFTVFAPTDAAFSALPAGTVDALLQDPTGELAQILLYHVASGKLMSTDLSDEQMIITLQGKSVKVDIIGPDVFINNAKVTLANLVADNGVVHVIDAVLLPPLDKAAFPIDFETKTDAVWGVFANGAGVPEDFMVIPNPDKSGINTSENVLKFKVNDGADNYAGAFSDSYAPIEITEKSHLVTMMVWKSVISPVGIKTEGSTNGGPSPEIKVSNTLINQWEKITFDLSAVIGFSYNRITIFPDFPALRTSGTTAYIDNIEKKVATTVVDIIVNSPDHTTLEAAVIAAELADDLSDVGPFTVFAPTDAAFAALPAGTVETLLQDPTGTLAQILLYHVANGNVMSADLSDNQIITTLQGKKVKINIIGGEVFINNAKVTVANVKADNGVVHVIDVVLLPSADVVVKDSETMGKILTDTYGSSLYFFSKDAFGASMCLDGCLTNWPVFYAGGTEFGAGLNAADFATIDRGSGVMQTTYKGWPLYYFVGDSRPGVLSGDGVIGKWFAAKPDYTVMLTDNQLTGNNGNKYKGDYTLGEEIIQYFTDDKGLTLYTWKNDKYDVNNFTKPDFSNNGVWPIYEQNKIVLPSVLNSADFNVITVFGKDQLTFKGWPLYYFGQDMMLRGNNKGVSVPSPGIWPVAVKDMMEAQTITSITDTKANNLKVFPNPVVDVLNVTFSDVKAEVAIYNSIGLLVESDIFVGKNARFDVSKYAPGVYFVKVNDGPVIKFVK